MEKLARLGENDSAAELIALAQNLVPDAVYSNTMKP
jgi:hypothetical protein